VSFAIKIRYMGLHILALELHVLRNKETCGDPKIRREEELI